MKTRELSHERLLEKNRRGLLAGSPGDGGVPEGGFEAVAKDIEALLTNSQDFWPADFGNYGGLMIRLAWHCNGSYRASDGRGGCDGGRIRFSPELTWMDNGNLDKALTLLDPIKIKYGSSLSWGDLVTLAGTIAIKSMGGPMLGFCGGRIDDANGDLSLPLGPSEEQRSLFLCEMDGDCKFPFGQTTLGLIYVNPEGPMGNPDPALSAIDIRDSFGRMGFNDSETVSLVGGGHAFGKMHGPCMEPPCGEGEMQGKGPNTYTAGFEGAWSTTPTQWSNEYFNNILDFNYTVVNSPGGPFQWEPEGPGAPNIVMLTADLALNADPSYSALTKLYASDLEQLETDFAHSWYRLSSRDMGDYNRCIGDMLPGPQVWQQPLPDPPAMAPDVSVARAAVQAMIDEEKASTAEFARLAFQCASTYRQTDHSGGCNGARIRFSPEKDWEVNAGLESVIAKLEGIDRGDVSMADLIVLAGYVAIENDGGYTMPFCGNRVDAMDAAYSENLAPRDYYLNTAIKVKDDAEIRGLTLEQGVALYGMPSDVFEFGEIFKVLTDGEVSGESVTFQGETYSLTEEQAVLARDPALLEYVVKFADDPWAFKAAFKDAWVHMMNAGRYTGPDSNYCDEGEPGSPSADTGDSSASFLSAASGAALALGGALLI